MITILLAAYNGGDYIKEQLESIKNQTYKDWHIIVRDDKSKDDTAAVVEKFAGENKGKVTLFVNDPATGAAKKNFARLLNDAKECDYVMCCDQDDVWKPDKLEKSINKMKQLEDRYGKNLPILVHGDVEVVDDSLQVISPSMFQLSGIPSDTKLSRLIIQNNVTGCTMLMNHTLVKNIIPMVQEKDIIMHDYVIALYAAVFGKTGVIKEPLLSYRQHGDNSVGAKNSKSISYLYGRFREGKAGYHKMMTASRKQIALFLEKYGDDMKKAGLTKEYELMHGYALLSEKGWFGKVIFYIRNDVWKYGLVRKIMQVIWS